MKAKFFCHAILLNNNKEMLILKRSNTDLYSNKWDLPGGYKKSKETFEECVIREFKEETGLDIQINSLKAIKAQIFKGEKVVVLLFLVSYNHVDKIILDKDHIDYKFIKIEELTKDCEDELIWYLKELCFEFKGKNQI